MYCVILLWHIYLPECCIYCAHCLFACHSSTTPVIRVQQHKPPQFNALAPVIFRRQMKLNHLDKLRAFSRAARFSSSTAATNPLRFEVGVACAAKGEYPRVAVSPRPNEAGEDSFFVVSDLPNNERSVALGVADGVGTWRLRGIDPSSVSRGLMKHAQDHLTIARPPLDLRSTLQTSFDRLMREREVKGGSCTASLLLLDAKARQLTSLNLGDSGFLIHRDGKIPAQSVPQLVAFNTPFQLCLVPPDMKAEETATLVRSQPSEASRRGILLTRVAHPCCCFR